MKITPSQIYTDFMQSVVDGGVTNPYGLAAIAATGHAESGFSPQNASGTWNDGKNNAGGIMSWNGPRLAALQRHSGGTNGTPQQQASFFLQENPSLIQKLNNAGSLKEAQQLMNNAWAFKGYDQPGNANAASRLNVAGQYLKQLSGDQTPQNASGYVDPQVTTANRNDAEGAVNALAAGGLAGVPTHMVQSVNFVPPPFSNQQPNFQSLIPEQAQPQAAQQPVSAPQAPLQAEPGPVQAAPLAAPQQNPDDVLKAFLPEGADTSPVAAGAQQQETPDDILSSFLPKDAPTIQGPANAPVVAAAPEKQSTTSDVIKSGASHLAQGAMDLIGLPGTIQNAFDNSLSAITGIKAPPPSPLSGEGLRGIAAKASEGATEYQPQTTLGKYTGSAAAMVPGALLGPENMLLNAFKFGVVPGVASEAAGQLTEGSKYEPAARIAASIASPLAVEGGLRAAAGAGNKLASLSPTAAAGSNIREALSASGQTADEVTNQLAANPRLSAMDVDPNLQQMAMKMATTPGDAKAVLKDAVDARAAGAKGAVSGAFDDALGQSPDTVKMLTDLRTKQQASVLTPQDLRKTLDDTMGAAADPKAALDDIITQRSADAHPLYEKAFEGGSIAPLEKQIEGAFSDASSASAQATKGLAAARQQQLLADAKTSQAGNNVYAASGASSASRDAQNAVATAEKNLAAANAQKESVLSRLRQAQQDGTANAPGAVWSPRVQQFLDDPIMQSGLAKGAQIQRLESLAEGKPFNPSEYAITGTDASGNPVIGSVPNMRTLNVAKKGLDRMVADATDPVTGKLSEEGRAINEVRKSFLTTLDNLNPDYKAARASWEGPSKVKDAFTKGLSLFNNKAGMSGIANTPDAIAAWVKKASPDEVQALKLGARSSLEQEMLNSANQVDKVARIAGVEANRQKLGTLIGKDQAGKVIDSLNAQHADPVGDAFSRGLDILRNRTGSSGLEDRPEFWRQWLSNASDSEKEAARQGARVAIDSQINSVRSAAAKGSAIPEVGFNKDRLEIILGKPEADKLAKTLADEQKIAKTNYHLFSGSDTATRQAANKLVDVTKVSPGLNLGPGALGTAGGALAYGMGQPLAAAGSILAGAGVSGIKMGAQAALRARDLTRNRLIAEAISGSPTQFQNAVSQTNATNKLATVLGRAQSPLLSATGAAVPAAASQNRLASPSRR